MELADEEASESTKESILNLGLKKPKVSSDTCTCTIAINCENEASECIND